MRVCEALVMRVTMAEASRPLQPPRSIGHKPAADDPTAYFPRENIPPTPGKDRGAAARAGRERAPAEAGDRRDARRGLAPPALARRRRALQNHRHRGGGSSSAALVARAEPHKQRARPAIARDRYDKSSPGFGRRGATAGAPTNGSRIPAKHKEPLLQCLTPQRATRPVNCIPGNVIDGFHREHNLLVVSEFEFTAV
ncbi:hypothetical protein EVAR_27691_1 [Eumeta japonica]|uniref:Uncharacterized protein n=1 Tax=Eumeta variegata TaxID=151549 RepID=A0A4C1WR14_EUMVA|nr:hypothetical protein EVAR_27691_1 [Eumeta japonica]